MAYLKLLQLFSLLYFLKQLHGQILCALFSVTLVNGTSGHIL